VLGSGALGAANKEQERLVNCGVVMQEIIDIPDNIPQELLEKADCVIVIPSMTKVAMAEPRWTPSSARSRVARRVRPSACWLVRLAALASKS
jgi:hypothetical protein